MLLAEATTTNYHDFGIAESHLSKHPGSESVDPAKDGNTARIANDRGKTKPFAKHLDKAIEREDTGETKSADAKRAKDGQSENKIPTKSTKKSPVRAEMLVTILDNTNTRVNEGASGTHTGDIHATDAKSRTERPSNETRLLEPSHSDHTNEKLKRRAESRPFDDVVRPKPGTSANANKDVADTALPGKSIQKILGNEETVKTAALDVRSGNRSADESVGVRATQSIQQSEGSGNELFGRVDVVERDGVGAALQKAPDDGSLAGENRVVQDDRIVTSIIDLTDRETSSEAAHHDTGAELGRVSTAGELGAGEGENTSQSEGDGSDMQARLLRIFSTERTADGEAPERSAAFSKMFRERMQPEILRQSTIVLKNNNRGEIRMTLRPENLGKLRMNLALDQNRISGRIIVESGPAKTLLDQNLESLSRSFRENGFDAANFEVTISGGDHNRQSENQYQEVAHERSDAAHVTRKMDETASLLEAHSDATINLVV